MTTFERVKQYVSTFDAPFAQHVRGASEEEIDELQGLLDGPLPDIYVDFLRVMGKDADWISIEKIDFSIDAVLRYYRRHDWPSAYNYVRIGEDPKDPAFHPYMEVNPLPDTEQEIIRIPDCSKETFDEVSVRFRSPLAGSLPELFAMPAFEMYEIYGADRNPSSVAANSWRSGAIDKAESILTAAGFEKLWFSTASGRAFKRQDAAVRLKQFGGHPLHVLIRADRSDEQARILQKLSPALAAAA